MRITGGKLKGLQLPIKFAPHVRPTTDMMREALFNKLVHTFGIENIRGLDLFSGSGIMSIEFISRGATSMVSVDIDNKNIAHQNGYKKEKHIENWQIVKGDVFKYLGDSVDKFDVIFADPPYDLPGIQNLVELAVEKLLPDGIFILEHRPGILFTGPLLESKKYGSTSISIFRY